MLATQDLHVDLLDTGSLLQKLRAIVCLSVAGTEYDGVACLAMGDQYES